MQKAEATKQKKQEGATLRTEIYPQVLHVLCKEATGASAVLAPHQANTSLYS